MQTDLRNRMDQESLVKSKHAEQGAWGRGLQKIKTRRPMAFALVVALSLALGACGMGEVKQNYMGLIVMGNDYKKNNDFANAIDCYNKALKEADTKFGPESGQSVTALGYLGQIYRAQGEWRLAYMTYKRLVPLKVKFEPKARETQDLVKDFDFVKSKIIEYGIKTEDNYGAEEMKKKSAANKDKKPKKKH
ncbi:MAG TPA: tetratricopeptide repeat protein [Candidatus Melainabacteria bacterium]|nr:tetratricopeptide repeat protein [Candidatus Melainabacteria bacterium]HIN63281.1 tetratricopeptide repeat protein [Candidatus Obscuribacterales bacterium]